LRGNLASIPGNVTFGDSNSSVAYTEVSNFVSSGIFSGPGTITISGAPLIQLSGDSSSFTGSLQIPSSSTFNMNGSFGATSTTTILNGATMTGGGTVGNLTSNGVISPGNSIGTIYVLGSLDLQSNSVLDIEIDSLISLDQIVVSGGATLAGTVNFTVPTPGFFGLGGTYTFLTSSGIASGTFAGFTISNPSVTGSLAFLEGADVALVIADTNPLADFPYINQNTRAVGQNLTALHNAGELDAALTSVTDAWVNKSNAEINDALNQMHPAPYSALLDAQAQLGGQIVSAFHRQPMLQCSCHHQTRLWAEPMGNWLKQGSLGEQVGFYAYTKGIMIGADFELTDSVVFGVGGSFDATDMQWMQSIGTGLVQRSLGGIYLDCNFNDFYFGWNVLAGVDDHQIRRHLDIPGINVHAYGDFSALDVMSQFSFAYFFGTPACLFYPYAIFDIFYLQSPHFTETNADGLCLQVNQHTAATIRSEAGVKIQVKDSNYYETICIAPSFGIGWAMECPIYRPVYVANFIDEPISFEAHGWNQTWQLFSLSFGLKMTFKSISFSGEYISEIAPSGRDQFWGQRFNIGLELVW
jgi:uncharacterized protein with beta-barrel porin domain